MRTKFALERLEQRDLFAGLVGEFPRGGGPITIRPTDGPVHASGLDFLSENNGLVPIADGDAAPFTVLLSNTSNQVTVGNLGSTVEIAGDLTLGIGARADAIVTATWGDATTPTPFPFEVNVSQSTLVGSFPSGGGPITVRSVGGPVEAVGLDFLSENNGLIPIPPGDLTGSAAPFTVLMSNHPGQVTFGNLGSTVTIDGELTLNVGARAGAVIHEASWGEDLQPVFFDVVEELPSLIGEFPLGGGPITVRPTAGPIEAAGLQFTSENSGLIPVSNDDASPFQILVNNTPDNVTFGSLGENVTIAGALTLSVGAKADAIVQGVWGGEAAPREFDVLRATAPSPQSLLQEVPVGILNPHQSAKIMVSHHDAGDLDLNTISAGIVEVVTPDGQTRLPRLVEVVADYTPESHVANIPHTDTAALSIWQLDPPQGGWQSADDGEYKIVVRGDKVANAAGVRGTQNAVGFYQTRVSGLAGSSTVLDANSDGRLDAEDIDAFDELAKAGEPFFSIPLRPAGMEYYRDYLIDEVLAIKEGDVDADGDVDFADFLVLGEGYGQPWSERGGALWSDGDFDHDGDVSFADFLKLSDNFGYERPYDLNV